MIVETAQDVSLLMGSPLAFDKGPFKIKTWHWVVGGLGLVVMACGILYIKDRITGKYNIVESNCSTSKFKNHRKVSPEE
ncbi:MAG TPA: hypothetical protein VNX01_10810 [Bacteroidia bacterium]|jgi:hypothetical protein|nr:hypothetical protein [Bacteroidia bacterium]